MATSTPQPAPPAELARRVARLQKALNQSQLDAMVVFDRTNVTYLTGFRSSLSYLLVSRGGAVLLVDGRYIEAAQSTVSHVEVRLFSDARASITQWGREVRPKRVGFEGSAPWAAVREWREALGGEDWEECGGLPGDPRIVKSPAEIKLIERSAAINDAVFEATLAALRPGWTEIDVRNFIRLEADRLGAEGLSFETIVAVGEMSSRPHYAPQARPLAAGQVLLIDMGMVFGGYCSDMTRVVALGKKTAARLVSAHKALLEAQVAAVEAVAPGVVCAEVDRIARDRLKAARLAQYFTHGLGHGVGLEIHEEPRLNTRATRVLEPGMVITVEPGVYLPGVGGLRIEDLVLVTRTGRKVLSRSPKELRVVPFS